MSAALQLPVIWGAGSAIGFLPDSAIGFLPDMQQEPQAVPAACPEPTPANPPAAAAPIVSLAFYRKHTEKMLRRYLYASLLIGRAPAILGEPVARGWAHSIAPCSAGSSCRSTPSSRQRPCWA